jgi:steroid delta-isomerase-like uncharacterized protein
MSQHDNVRTAERLLNSLNTRNLDQVDDLFTQDYQGDGPGSENLNRQQSKANMQGYLDAFPDLKFEVLRRIAQDEYVVLDWVSTGTHTGPMRTPSGNTIPPTGKWLKIFGSTTYEFRDGKIAHAWTYWDRVAMLDQLGLLPPM